jgi:RNA polymerase sigma-70 factor (ECF subfamily)
VQDAWVAALRNPPREEDSLRAWLSRVVRRLARGRDPRRERPVRAFERDDAPPTDDVVARIEQERLLARLVVELEEPYRAVVLQRYYRGLSAARIARIERLPPATVRTRLRRALAMLRQRLEREERSGPP